MAIITSSPLGLRNIVISVSVCLSVCMCVCLSAQFQKSYVQMSRNFLYFSPVAMARFFADDRAIRCVLPALSMTSCFHIMVQLLCCNWLWTFFLQADTQTLSNVELLQSKLYAVGNWQHMTIVQILFSFFSPKLHRTHNARSHRRENWSALN